jgi:hypothetical protein
LDELFIISIYYVFSPRKIIMTLSSTIKSLLEKITSALESFGRARAATELARAGYHTQANELINRTGQFTLQ